MKKRGLYILATIIIIVAIVSVYLTFFYYPKCNDPACWSSKLKECSRATYTSSPVDVTWKYTILGKDNVDGQDKCRVKVLALDIKRGLKKTESLEGKDMVCYLPFGSTVAPEANPNICTGRLKEEIQVLIIEKLHEYIIQSLGELSSQVTQIEGVTGVSTQTANNQTQNNNDTNSSS